ncbi:hypothetical protein CDIK_2271 [Cucumispora dikerogammari]|nr:hypothetical protein CDIK_2271 [Cucumispora dikerogammari]
MSLENQHGKNFGSKKECSNFEHEKSCSNSIGISHNKHTVMDDYSTTRNIEKEQLERTSDSDKSLNIQKNGITDQDKCDYKTGNSETEKKIYVSTMKTVVKLLNDLEDIEKDPYFCLNLSEKELNAASLKEREKVEKKEKKLQSKNFKKSVSKNRHKIEKKKLFEKTTTKGFVKNVSELDGKVFSEREYYKNNKESFHKKTSRTRAPNNSRKGSIKPLKKVRTRMD